MSILPTLLACAPKPTLWPSHDWSYSCDALHCYSLFCLRVVAVVLIHITRMRESLHTCVRGRATVLFILRYLHWSIVFTFAVRYYYVAYYVTVHTYIRTPDCQCCYVCYYHYYSHFFFFLHCSCCLLLHFYVRCCTTGEHVLMTIVVNCCVDLFITVLILYDDFSTCCLFWFRHTIPFGCYIVSHG